MKICFPMKCSGLILFSLADMVAFRIISRTLFHAIFISANKREDVEMKALSHCSLIFL